MDRWIARKRSRKVTLNWRRAFLRAELLDNSGALFPLSLGTRGYPPLANYRSPLRG